MTLLKTSILSFLLLTVYILTASAQSLPVTQEKVTYFLGEVKMSSPTGQIFGSSISLVKRTLKPAENKIIELVASVDAREPTREYTTIFEVKDSKFTVKDMEGTFAGEGEFIGQPWEWTGWKYSVNMLGQRKGQLKAEDTLTSGSLTVKKSFAGADGQVRVIFAEDLKPISKEMYELLHAKLLPKQN
jgi:hypothetical protein